MIKWEVLRWQCRYISSLECWDSSDVNFSHLTPNRETSRSSCLRKEGKWRRKSCELSSSLLSPPNSLLISRDQLTYRNELWKIVVISSVISDIPPPGVIPVALQCYTCYKFCSVGPPAVQIFYQELSSDTKSQAIFILCLSALENIFAFFHIEIKY